MTAGLYRLRSRWQAGIRLSLLAASLLTAGCIRRRGARDVAATPQSTAGSALGRGVGPQEETARPALTAVTQRDSQPVEPPANGKLYPEPPLSHEEALRRHLNARWERRSDKDRHVDLLVPDRAHWKRVRFLGVEHLTGFQYGPDRHVVTGVFVQKTAPGQKPSSRLCMEKFEEAGFAKFRRHKGHFTPVQESPGTWKGKPILIHQADGRVTVLFSRYEFSAAWAAYPAYRDGCLVWATVVFWEDEKKLAQQVRDYWVRHAFGGMRPRTRVVPSRLE